MNHARQHHVEKSRVHHLTKGYAKGGAAHYDEKQDRKLIKSMIGKAIHAEGHKPKHRMDKPHRAKGGKVKCRADGGPVVRSMAPSDMLAEAQRRHDQAVKEGRVSTVTNQLYQLQGEKPGRAKGGRVKGKSNAKTVINVITGGHPAAGAVPPGPAMAPPGPPMGVAPAAPPPMAAKPPMPMPPPGAGPGGPPMPMRAKGGRVNQGTAVYEEGKKAGTQVQHSDGHATANKNLGRGKPITFKSGGRVRHFYAKGGKVEASDAIAPATKLPGGSGGGEARLVKAHREARGH